MRTLSKITIAAATVFVLVAALTPAQAACGTFATLTTNNGGGASRSFVFNPGVFTPSYATGYPPFTLDYTQPFTPAVEGIFWKLGTGDPTIGLGDDYGLWPSSAKTTTPPYQGGWLYWFSSYSYSTAGDIFTGWGEVPTIDGCIGGAGNCTCVVLTDQNGTDGFFAAISAPADGTSSTFLNQAGVDPAGNGAPIQLASIPSPSVDDTIRDGNLDLSSVKVTVPPPAGGLYFGGGCDCIADGGYKVLFQTVPGHNNPAPADRAVGSGWQLAPLAAGGTQGVTPFGVQVDLAFACGASDQDIFLATQLVFDNQPPSVWELDVVSANATRIECGPNLANPTDVQQIRREERPKDGNRRKARTR